MTTTSTNPGWLVAKRLLHAALAALGLVFCWWALTSGTGWVSSMRFPTPQETWAAWQQMLWSGYANALWHEHAWRSIRLVFMGFAISSSIGVLLGLAMGASRKVEAIANPVFLFLRPIPPLAWIPLAIVWLGLGDSAKLMVIFVAAFVPSVINSFSGVRQIERPIFEAAANVECVRLADVARGPDSWCFTQHFYRATAFSPSLMDNAGCSRAGRCHRWAWADSQSRCARHFPGHDSCGHVERCPRWMADDAGSGRH